MKNTLYGRDIVSIGELSESEITLILDTAATIKQEGRPDYLKGKILGSCFFEPSTRTRLSFEAAMMRLGGQVIGFADSATTSTKKGETLSDSMRILSGYADAIVLRHSLEGAARLAAEVSNKPVINAGDGANSHPTQTLLDLFTIRECQGKLTELHMAFVGDLKYGRTVHSLAQAGARYHMRYYFVSPDILMMPDNVCDSLKNAGVRFSCHNSIEEVVDQLDILYMTRLQKERFAESEFKKVQDQFSLSASMLKNVKPNFRVLHPLPRVNELHTDVDKTPYAYYFEQAANGLFVREAILSLLLREV